MKSCNEQTYFSMNKREVLSASGEELSWGGGVRVGFFLGGNRPGRNFPEGNCPYGDIFRGELSGRDFNGHPLHHVVASSEPILKLLY